MYGIHDMGGMEGFGPVEVEADEPYFHEPWERRAFGVTTAIFSLLRGGEFRHSIERMDPAHYLTSSYYEHWVTGGATALVEHGHTTRAELERRAGGFPLARPLDPTAALPETEAETGAGAGSATPRFRRGDAVRVRRWVWHGHTRCPRYVQGRRGTVVRVDAVAPLPDVEVHTERAQRHMPTYSVRFDAAELWGEHTEPGTTAVHVDLWESYLEQPGGDAEP